MYALITGSASRLGHAMAVGLSHAGITPIIHYHNSEDSALALREKLFRTDSTPILLHADLARPDGSANLIATALQQIADPADLLFLINNAANYRANDLANCTYNNFVDDITLNLWTPLELSRQFYQHREKVFSENLANAQLSPCIINITDARVNDHDPHHLTYELSKKSLADLTNIQALSYAPLVRVNAIAPGLIIPQESEPVDYLEHIKNSNPLHENGDISDILSALMYLINSKYVTGQTLYVDGGRHLRGIP